MTDFLQLASDRYSVRSFSSAPVPDDVLNRILSAGRLAPTAMNRQPQRIYVIRSSEAMAKLVASKPCYNAPVVLMVCGDTSAACGRPKVDHNLAEMDCSIVATHMMLACADEGLGSCWICAFRPDEVARIFNLPENVVPFMLLPIGYPAPDAAPSPRHADRAPLDEKVTYL